MAKMTRTTLYYYSGFCLQIANFPPLYLYSPYWMNPKRKGIHKTCRFYVVSSGIPNFLQILVLDFPGGHNGHRYAISPGMHQFLVIRYRQNVWTKDSIREQSREIDTIILIVPQFGTSTGLRSRDILFRSETKQLSQLHCTPTGHNRWLPCALSLDLRRPRRDADHPRPSRMRTSANLLPASSLCRGA